jgi:uncharacterized protein
MNPEALIHKYYAGQPELEDILLRHSRQVADLALRICQAHPELDLDQEFIFEAAMLHDIGIIRCDAPGIKCFGTEPYLRHGQVGGEMLRQESLPRHARVAERHTGAGLPSWLPETLEEQVICYADKFFSKSRIDHPKDYEGVIRSLSKFGAEGVERFRHWHEMFSTLNIED